MESIKTQWNIIECDEISDFVEIEWRSACWAHVFPFFFSTLH